MKRNIFLLLLLLCSTGGMALAQELMYAGKIAGPGAIELELSSTNDSLYTGRYRYTGKPEWQLLTGAVTGETKSNLHLKATAADGSETGSFHLTFDGDYLNGTWQAVRSLKTLGVMLQLKEDGPDTTISSDQPDGYFYADENEIRAIRKDGNKLDVGIWINNATGCAGILLKGDLIATARDWQGVLTDEISGGKAMVSLQFEGHYVKVMITPQTLPPSACNISRSPYRRDKKRADGELD